jgi:cell shape-determining protein MreC
MEFIELIEDDNNIDELNETDIIEKTNILSNYQKNKKSILKWRELNKDKYLYNQHLYNLKQYADPDKRIKKLEKIKEYQKNKRALNNSVIRKVGRPSKYDDKLIEITN